MAQTQLYTQKAQIHIIEETTVDTYLVQATDGSGALLCEQVTLSYDSSNYEPAYVRGDFLSFDEIPGMVAATMTFRAPIKGSGTAGTAPEVGEYLKACGMEEETVATTSVTYSPVSTFDGASGNPGQSYSLSWLLNGVKHSIKGAFGTWKISATAGDPTHYEFTFSGAYNAFADDALESTSYDTTAAQPFLGATFATNIGGAYTPLGIENFSLDLGNKLAQRKDCNNASGIMGYRITGRKSTGSFDCELATDAVMAAVPHWYTSWRAGTAGTITTGAVGATAGNIYTIAIARAILRPPESGDNEGIARLTLPFGVSSAATDVEDTNPDVSIAYT
jgi:hypothetical protein